jgi:hypothetical protein
LAIDHNGKPWTITIEKRGANLAAFKYGICKVARERGQSMPIYEFAASGIAALAATTFSAMNLHERRDLQRLLRESVDVISPDTLVISEEFGEFEDSKRRIDLLGIDRDANLVVIELKRTEDGGHMELQAIRYASMVSTMTFDAAVSELGKFLKRQGKTDQDPRETILEFLSWDAPDEDEFAQDVRIVLASAEFSKEITSSVLWLNDHGVDIRCVRLKPYNLENRLLVDIQQIIPLPEAAEFQVQIRDKLRKEREARVSGIDFTRYNVEFDGEQHSSMWKRNALFLICKRLCEKSVSPEVIAESFAGRRNRVWYSVDGTVNAGEFAKLALAKAASGGPAFSERRWFCDDDELIHFGARTYAFSDQWGGKVWRDAMTALKEAYPQYNIEFAPAA